MGLHRGHDNALGQREEALVERPGEHDWALDQVHHLVQHAARVAPAADGIECLDDQAAALLRVRLDPVRPQRVLVGGRVGDLDLPAGEAVPEGRTTRGRPVELDGDGLPVELCAQPAHRPREAGAAGAPHHRLAEREPVHDRAQPPGQHVGEGNARDDRVHVTVAPLEPGDIEAGAAREALRGLRRTALLVERHPLRRAATHLVRGSLRQLLHQHGEAPGPDQKPRGLLP